MREFDLLQHVYARSARLPAHVTIPPGDDMGALQLAEAKVLVTVDQLADGVHVNLANTPIDKVARKAITRNLSDVAAMAAVPVGAVVAASLPRDFGEQQANDLFDHMSRVAAAFDCPLVGGDVSMWDHPLLLTVTVLAEPRGIEPVLRRGAKVGDVVCVTGALGGSLFTLNGYTHHLDFEPRLRIARALAGDATLRPNCMIDLSDGLASDLGHLCRAANRSAIIDENLLPISAAAQAMAQRDSRPAWQHALGDGEDYELCFTVSAAAAQRLPRAIDGVPITQIGHIVERLPGGAGDAIIGLKRSDGAVTPVRALGWEHQS